MIFLTLLAVSVLCLAISATRPFGAVSLLILCLIKPLIFLILLIAGLGVYLFKKPIPLFLPKE